MRVLLSTIGSRGDVQPLVALAVHLKTCDHEVRLCVPPDFREWIEGLGIPVTPIGPEVRRFAASRPPATEARAPLTPEQRRQFADATVVTQFETIAAAAHGCDVIVAATALQFAARSVAEKMGIAYVFAAYSPNVLPSPHHPPPALPPLPGDLAALFRRVAAVVHHGGAGTTTAAALAAAPQVVSPHQYDQHYWGRQVERLGIGTVHPTAAATADSLIRALEPRLTADVAARAGHVATLVRRDGVRVAVQELEKVVGRA